MLLCMLIVRFLHGNKVQQTKLDNTALGSVEYLQHHMFVQRNMVPIASLHVLVLPQQGYNSVCKPSVPYC
jgi:hypothetical protein